MKKERKILLVCGLGMSTSLLVKKMREQVKYNFEIDCCDIVSAQVKMCEYNLVLLAPHISYMKNIFINKAKHLHIPLMLIDKEDYQNMNGKVLLNKIDSILDEYQKEYPFKVVLLHALGGVMSDLMMLDMKKKLNGREKDWLIESIDIGSFNYQDSFVNVILLEPQIKFEMEKIKRQIGKESLVVINVPPRAKYASFNGRIMLDYINEIYDVEFKKIKKSVKQYMEETYESNF